MSKIQQILAEVHTELEDATAKHGEFHSAHEGYAVLLEETEELWAQVKLKRSQRDKANMRKECIQIAAMSVKFIMSILEK